MNAFSPSIDAAAVPLFALDQVSFSIAGRRLLEPVSLTLPKQRVIGLIGHNGSGKSTLVKILARQQRASQGVVQFQGRTLSSWGEREFARKLAYLPQYTPLASGLLVKELVALGRYPWHGPLRSLSAIDREKIAEAIELADLAALGERLVDTLSGGERQRAWLAMLMAQDSECLLLDEPISALDLAHQIEMLTLVQTLSRRKGLGVLVVLHDINMAARFCDEIIALHSGKVIARGAPQAVMTGETLRRIYGIDFDVMMHPGAGHPVALAR